MIFNDLTRTFRKYPNIRVLIICTLILIRHPEVSSYSEIVFRVYNSYIDMTNHDLYVHFCKKLQEVYSVDITQMSISDINSVLEDLAVNYCTNELDVAIDHSYLTEMQKFKVNSDWSQEQIKLLGELTKYYDNSFAGLVNPCMTNHAIIYIAIINECDKRVASVVSSYTFSDEILYQICIGIIIGIDLTDYVLQGYSKQDLEKLLKCFLLNEESI